MKKIYFAFLFSLLILPAARLWAFTYTEDFAKGFYWKSFPVSIKVVESDHNEQDRLEGFLQVAIDQWQQDQDVVLWELDYGTASANTLRWSDRFAAETGFPEDSTLGVTIRYNRGSYFERVEIILNKKIATLVANKGNLLGQTVSHELAHTLGLGHTEESGLMYPLIGAFNEPNTDDVEGLRAVVKETIRRQDTNYVVPGTLTSTKTLGCAGTGNTDAASMGGGFLLSLFLGFMPLALMVSIRQKIGKLLPPRN